MQNSDENGPTLGEGIDEALEGEPRAAELLKLTNALQIRRDRLAMDRDHAETTEEALRITSQLQELDEQIQVLTEEATISHFVEETVRFSHEVRRLHEG